MGEGGKAVMGKGEEGGGEREREEAAQREAKI